MSSRCLLCCVPLVQGDSMPTCDRITTESAVKAANAQLVVVIIPLKELVCCYALRERLANPTAHNKAGFGKQKKDLSFRPVLLSHFLLWTVQISSGTWIRTTTRGFKVLRPAIRRFSGIAIRGFNNCKGANQAIPLLGLLYPSLQYQQKEEAEVSQFDALKCNTPTDTKASSD